MDVMAEANARAKTGEDIIHMEVGQPATPAPRAARERAQQALSTDRLGYTEALGLPALRERIARYVGERYGVAVRPERVVVTAGSSAGFVLAFLALLDPGDGLGLPSPGYPCYRQILKALGARPLLLETSGQGRWMPTVADVERLACDNAAGLLLASPNNPTGTMALKPRLAEVAAACRRLGLWLISDEIYHGLDYAFAAETAANVSERALVINSFSKYFCMTGWRVGWMVVPESLVRAVERLQGNLAISVPTLSQVAAQAAFDGRDEMEAVKHGYEAKRRILTQGLPKAGLDKFLPVDGAFYLYADISKFSGDSLDFAKRMLNEAHVAATPGIDFDPVNGHNFLRFCYAGSSEEMHEAVERIGNWLKR
ncbi:MAG TPA: 1-aminocyclopropane-1-carboxylate deaminase [Rhizobiales bacterium]|nr:1-aminocyclopropane-1-carboxylate deaminase [Hyphomicrobiales bacterium]